MVFYDYGEPIRYIVDRYFERKKLYSANGSTYGYADITGTSLSRGEAIVDTLPDLPCHLLRDDTGRVQRIIYGEVSLLESGEECDPVIWQEELLRNETGRVTGVITTYPDGETVTTQLLRDSDGKVTDYTYEVIHT